MAAKSLAAALTDAARCSGCGLCQLVCPAWRQTLDVELTPLGRCKALQHGSVPAELTLSLASCNLCGACDAVCPERIDLFGLTRVLRLTNAAAPLQKSVPAARRLPADIICVLVADAALRARPETLARVRTLLGGVALAEDDGADIVAALESGAPVAPQRVADFLAQFPADARIVVADGLLLRVIQPKSGGAEVSGLGTALSVLAPLRQALRPGDLYVIEPRAYHVAQDWRVGHYDTLRHERGCAMNLDLQRIAIPATTGELPGNIDPTAQARWVVHGRSIERIVIESETDRAAFAALGEWPVVHLADVAGD